MNASSGSLGVDETLSEEIDPLSTSKRMRSVKVPPVSIPMRFTVIHPYLGVSPTPLRHSRIEQLSDLITSFKRGTRQPK